MESAVTSLVSMSLKCTEAITRGFCPANEKILKDSRNARRVRKRTYFKAISAFSAYKGQQLRWITLTSTADSTDAFQQNFRKLIMRLRRRGHVKEYLRVPEAFGNGGRHEHILFLGSYIQQQYLSYLWGKLSGAPVVWISKVGKSTARYLAKYASKCPQWRVSNSRAWCRRRLCGVWEDTKRIGRRLNIPFGKIIEHFSNSLFLQVNPVDFLYALMDAPSVLLSSP